MPLSVNVGLSRKASRDFQSTGVSINVVAELDSVLLARPEELQRQIHGLYDQARKALDHQTEMPGDPPAPRAAPGPSRCASGNGSRASSPMTGSQRRAITAIASRVGVDPDTEARQIIGAELKDLSLRQASELIDHLKAQADAPASR